MTAAVDHASELRQALASELVQRGTIIDSAWRTAVEQVPREVFLGEAVFQPRRTEHGTEWVPVRRAEVSQAEWEQMAYTDVTWVTQIDGVGAEEAVAPIQGEPSCSSTLPGLMVAMLDAAEIGDGERVLEIGTGTGYSTALLCHRLGSPAVSSIEYDPRVAAQARAALHQLGHGPDLRVGDGLDWPARDLDAEYDRLVATCAVRYLPAAWIWQVRAGGTITAPLSGWMTATAFAHVTIAEDGTAEGRFRDEELSFMFARPHARPPRSYYRLGLGEERETRIDPRLLGERMGVFLAQLAAPSAEKMGSEDRIILLDVATGSQATTRPTEHGTWTVRQHGPLNLWDAVEDAILIWQEAGSPDIGAFGLTATPRGQRVWLGSPDGPSWTLPA